MILTVDIGNTNICFSIHNLIEDTPLFFERIHTDRNKCPADYAALIRTIFALHRIEPGDIKDVALSSVVCNVGEVVYEALTSVLSCRILRISCNLDLGYKINVDNPPEVGQDILCDVAGALALGKGPVITFDMGTATVSTFVSDAPAIESVFICPGVRTSLNSLADNTAALPDISLDPPEKAIGKTTVEGMRSGIIYGTAGLVDGLIRKYEEMTGTTPTVIATGGLSKFIVPYCTHEIRLEPELLMKGMWHILRRN